MEMKFKRNHRFLNELPGAVPLVGVLFLFLFYLLTNSALLLTKGTPLTHLPDGSAARPEGFSHSVVVAMDHNAKLYYQNQHVARETLSAILSTLVSHTDGGGLLLILQAHRGVQYNEITRFAALAEIAGVKQIWLATRPEIFE